LKYCFSTITYRQQFDPVQILSMKRDHLEFFAGLDLHFLWLLRPLRLDRRRWRVSCMSYRGIWSPYRPHYYPGKNTCSCGRLFYFYSSTRHTPDSYFAGEHFARFCIEWNIWSLQISIFSSEYWIVSYRGQLLPNLDTFCKMADCHLDGARKILKKIHSKTCQPQLLQMSDIKFLNFFFEFF